MATEVSVRDITSGDIVFYSTYEDAAAAANEGDVISVYANLDERIILKNLVDVYIAPGTIIDFSEDKSTITDNEDAIICNITGGGIIRNSSSESKAPCIEIANSDSVINIECFSVEGLGDQSDTTGNSTVTVTAASRFSLICNLVHSRYNTAVQISNCNDYFLNIRTVETGELPYYNEGAPVMVFEGSGSIYIHELICTGLGSCLQLKDGVLAATIQKISTLVFDPESAATSASILLDGGTGDQELVLYFDDIKNLNPNGADCANIFEGKASLIGRRIYSESSKSLDLRSPKSVFVKCDEIISLLEGINIYNSTEAAVIDAKYIQGSDANGGVVRCNNTCNLVLRNAKIVNTTESTSIGIYITDIETLTQKIELENLIIVTGTGINDFSIFRFGEDNNLEIKNLLLFVKKAKSSNVILQIGDLSNFKYIIDDEII